MTTSKIQYPNMPEHILKYSPQFASSTEHLALVDEGMDDLPGVFLARYGRFLMRLVKEGEKAAFVPSFNVIEILIGDGDQNVKDAVVNEVFEIRGEPLHELQQFFAQLGPSGRELYERTCKPLK